ncbi:hypothetical protein B0H13DRAFT_2135483 [Mycena leptocephala]|nr:hypothetical protein B0H13DRAFT_2135483 [Mycena leptocephala]
MRECAVTIFAVTILFSTSRVDIKRTPSPSTRAPCPCPSPALRKCASARRRRRPRGTAPPGVVATVAVHDAGEEGATATVRERGGSDVGGSDGEGGGRGRRKPETKGERTGHAPTGPPKQQYESAYLRDLWRARDYHERARRGRQKQLSIGSACPCAERTRDVSAGIPGKSVYLGVSIGR